MKNKFIASPIVEEKTGKSRSTIWRWERLGLFPKRIKFGPNSSGWLESDVDRWIEEKAGKATSDQGGAA